MNGVGIRRFDGFDDARSADAPAPRGATMAADTPRWVQPLAVTVLVLTLLYVVFGIPGEDTTDTSQTDRVSPLNSYIWLGLLLLSGPVLKVRLREVVALLRANRPLLMLLAYFTLSVGWALDPSASARRLIFTFLQIILFATLLTGIRRAPVVHVAIAAICLLAATADLASWFIVPGIAMTDEGFAGLQGQKNQTGLLMMYGCLSSFTGVFLVRRWVPRLALLGATAMMGALLIATRSTTSQSVVISAALVLPMLLLIAQLPRRFIVSIAALAVVVPVVALFGYYAVCRVTGLDPMQPLAGATFTARTDIWSFVVEEIGKRPWFGAGYSSFWSIDPLVQPSLKSNQWFGVYAIINEAHDGYLDLLATGGIIGLIGGLWVLFRTIGLAGQAMAGTQTSADSWRTGQLSRPTAVFYLALTLGLVLHNFTESNLFSNNGMLAVAFLLCVLDLEKWRITAKPR